MHGPLPVDRAVKLLHEATATVTGAEFFRALARSVAQVFGVPMGLVGRVEPDGLHVHTLAFWNGEGFQDMRYALEGTPCEEVLTEHEPCQHPAGVARTFPEDRMFAEAGIESYFAVPIRSAVDGRSLGLVAALGREPTEPVAELASILGLFAARAGAEIERLDAAASLARREALYRMIVTQCTDGVWLVDATGVTTYVNPQMSRMLGYEPDEMIGRTLFDFMDDEGRRTTLRNLGRRQRGIADHHEFRLVHRDGSPVWTVMSTGPVTDPDGSYVGALALVADLTERRALELRVLEAQRLESIGVLAGGIAHDFNNVLVGILGNAELALLRGSDDPRQKASLEAIQKAALRAADLTRQLLTYAGRARADVRALHLEEVLKDTRELLATTLSKRVSLELELEGELPAVLGDRGQLTQVFMNLVTNAGDAMGERGGTIHIEARRVLGSTLLDSPLQFRPAAPDPETEYVRIDVRDEGIAMDETTRQRVFDPFFTTKASGRGLGLAAVLGILRGHRGCVAVTSARGRGTTFTLLVPAENALEHVAPPDSGVRSKRETPVPPTRRLLVVDDEPSVRDVTTAILRGAGFEVESAVDGADAIAKLDAGIERFAALVLDLRMPKIGGLEVLRHVRRHRPELPVVVVSGYSEATDRLPLDAHTRFLAKPYAARELLATLDALFGTRARAAAS